MERRSRKITKVAPNAEANTTKNEQIEEQPQPEEFILIPPMQVDKKTKTLAKKFGIDVDTLEQIPLRINEYVQENEKRWAVVAQQLEGLKPLLQLSQQLANRPQQPQPTAANPGIQSQAGLLQTLLPLMGQFMGQQDDGFAELGKKALMSQINMSNAITNAVVSKIAAKATTEVADSIA